MMNAPDNLPPDRNFAQEPDRPVDGERETSNRPLPLTDDDPDVGLSQKGTGEDAVVRRETEI